ncbi:hypothetical protein APX70_05916 [Pseudomonas syringae pv. maculicola]|uniref:DUF6957 domain-containing protein n=1 Tax=Pseudomonas syringae pv. maculicola TaxID=59511 RepID=A0A3M2VZQ7_PSEYM|nr:hypothetical protein [Pseudomonas syringae group genomosp. 3]RML44789.1 hypothetical protein APX70_05916 [Pseudomonas syringae pv. maculicola]
MMNLTGLARLFSGQGKPTDGCSLSLKEAALAVQEKFASRPYCLVSDWTILDIDVNAEELNALHTRGLEPVLVYALCVVSTAVDATNPAIGCAYPFRSVLNRQVIS